MKPVTDAALIQALEEQSGPVTDPAVLDQLNREPVEFSAGEMISNIPTSAVKLGKDIATAVTHPIDTATGVGNVAMGVVDKGARTLTEALPEDVVRKGNQFNNWLSDLGIPLKRVAEDPKEMQFPQEQYADQVGQFIKDRYGSSDAFKKTAMEDPVGMLADFASVLTGAGGVAGKSTVAGKALRRAGAAVDPLSVAANTVKGVVKAAIPKDMPAKMYQSAAKFGTTIAPADRARMTETALTERIMPTVAGLDKLDTLTSALNTGIDGLIEQATKSGKTIPKGAVFRHLKEVRQKLGGPKIDAAQNLERVNRLAAKFNEHMRKMGKDSLTPSELQAFKKDAYKTIDFKRSQQKASLAGEEARKAMARAAKESIEQTVPGVKDMNARLGSLLELRQPLEKSAARISNLNINSINTPLNIGAGGAVAGPVGAAAGAVMAVLEMPRIKAKGAIWLNKVKNMTFKQIMASNDPDIAMIRQALVQSGRAGEMEQERSPVPRSKLNNLDAQVR